MGYEGHKWRDLAQGREQWRDLVFAAMSFRVPNNNNNNNNNK